MIVVYRVLREHRGGTSKSPGGELKEGFSKEAMPGLSQKRPRRPANTKAVSLRPRLFREGEGQPARQETNHELPWVPG